LLPVTLGHTTESTVPPPHKYRLRFYHTHTGERLDVVYRRGDRYIPEALDELDHYLRDHRTGDVRHFDPRLFDLLYELTASLGDSGGEIEILDRLLRTVKHQLEIEIRRSGFGVHCRPARLVDDGNAAHLKCRHPTIWAER
jgi:uncharacterized protein YcbK (DUF882 family)